MGPHTQTAIVAVVIAACVLILARRFAATFIRKRGGSCGCDTCPAKQDGPR